MAPEPRPPGERQTLPPLGEGPAAPRLGDPPLRPVTPGEFARMRALLEQCDYRTAVIQARRESDVAEEISRSVAPGAPIDPPDPAEALIRLFIDGHPIPRAEVEQRIPAELTGLLEKVGLIEERPDGALNASMALYPTGPLYIVSDPWLALAGRVPEDIVFPALSANTVEFLKALPTDPCDALLDLGAGTGVAALISAPTARRVWASDIASRSRIVAAFNAALNGIENLTSVEGDLYAPVEGLTFDRIVTHPPYVPAPENRVIFRDGGEDGEQFTRRILGGLADHLRPGGVLYCRCMATDRKEAPLEQRVRGMLGPAADAFDVFLVPTLSLPASAYFGNVLKLGRITPDRFAHQMRIYDRLGVENVVIGFIVILRHDAERPPLTVRRQFAGDVDPFDAAIDWLCRWERMAADPGFTPRLLEAKPRITPAALIEMAHRSDAGRLRAVSCRISADWPFLYDVEGPASLALLFERCDGSRSVATLRRELTEAGVLPVDADPDQFLGLTRALLGGGVLEIDEHPLPDRPPGPAA